MSSMIAFAGLYKWPDAIRACGRSKLLNGTGVLVPAVSALLGHFHVSGLYPEEYKALISDYNTRLQTAVFKLQEGEWR